MKNIMEDQENPREDVLNEVFWIKDHLIDARLEIQKLKASVDSAIAGLETIFESVEDRVKKISRKVDRDE